MVSLPCSSPQLAETEGGAGVEWRRQEREERQRRKSRSTEKKREDRWKGNK